MRSGRSTRSTELLVGCAVGEFRIGLFKPGDRVLCEGWSVIKPFIAIVERPSRSGSSYLAKSEVPIYRIRTHIKGQTKLQHFYGYLSVLDVREVTALDEIAQLDREPYGP